MRRKHPQVDRNRRDALVGSGDSVGLSLDLLAHLIEIRELLSFAVKKLGPLCKSTQGQAHEAR